MTLHIKPVQLKLSDTALSIFIYKIWTSNQKVKLIPRHTVWPYFSEPWSSCVAHRLWPVVGCSRGLSLLRIPRTGRAAADLCEGTPLRENHFAFGKLGDWIWTRASAMAHVFAPDGCEHHQTGKKTQNYFQPESVAQQFSLPQVIIQGMSSVQAVEGLDSLSLDLIRSKRRPKVSIKDFWSKSWVLVLATQTYQT